MEDFKDSVGTVFGNAMEREYPRRMVQSVWSRFLFQRWHSTDIAVKELRSWFSRVWAFLIKSGYKKRPEPTQHVEALSSASDFLRIFGVPRDQEANRQQAPTVSWHHGQPVSPSPPPVEARALSASSNAAPLASAVPLPAAAVHQYRLR